MATLWGDHLPQRPGRPLQRRGRRLLLRSRRRPCCA